MADRQVQCLHLLMSQIPGERGQRSQITRSLPPRMHAEWSGPKRCGRAAVARP